MAILISDDDLKMQILCDEDYAQRARQHSWKARTNDEGRTFHAVRWDNAARLWVSMHRDVWLMRNPTIPDPYVVDHQNTNGLDNRYENLRLLTRTQNNANRRQFKSNRAGFKGVRSVGNGRFSAKITRNGLKTHLGTFSTAEAAAAAYDMAARAVYGDACLCNFP